MKGAKRLGVRVGYWLSVEQGKKLIASPSGPELRAVRNRAILAMLIGCGLRRAEVVTVAVEDFALREDHWVLVDRIDKGGHMHTVPVPDWVKAAVDAWTSSASLKSGVLFRPVGKTGKVRSTGFTAKVIWSIVRKADSGQRTADSVRSRRMIFVEPAPAPAIKPEANWNRSSFF